ncbi:hypothetical protein Bca52824_001821 [Brassica carinata]|uniref:F-box associated beta-propeller type 1 domain-containing protein n=1 Tax=Brassica carinata TaxID=52824 RepID=A0A8X7WJC3_BRACI|nr:hypothetical protein Bca52824_001821 [Brassica carinata]
MTGYGILLCVREICNLVMWNPFLGQTRCIRPRSDIKTYDMFAFGYDKNNRKHKILRSGVCLKGNTYFVAQRNRPEFVDVLLCFDFTKKRFFRPLPFHYDDAEYVVLSFVREEKLAVLYQTDNTVEIWITTKIKHDDVSWSKLLEVEMTPLNGFPDGFDTETESSSLTRTRKSLWLVVYAKINQSGGIKPLKSLDKMDT